MSRKPHSTIPLLSKISSSVGFSKIINNFAIQKEKEKLTIFPLVMVNDNEKNENGDPGIGNHGNDEDGSFGDHEKYEEYEQFWKNLKKL